MTKLVQDKRTRNISAVRRSHEKLDSFRETRLESSYLYETIVI